MLRIGLFLLTNIAVIALAGIMLRLFGFDYHMTGNGIDLNLQALLVWSAVIGFAGSLFSLFISKWMAKRSMGVQIIEKPANERERWLYDTVAELAEKAGIKMPEVGIFPAPQSNAFATGWNRNDALVAVSEGLLQRMSREEVKAVVGHEIGHVANGDMVTLTLIQGVVNTFVFFFARIIGHFVDRVIFRNEGSGGGIGYFAVVMIAQVVLGIFASMIVMWFSRRREFRADEAGASLVSAAAMTGALESLKRETEIPSPMPETFTAFGISKGKPTGVLASIGHLFSSHPPLDARIAALRGQQ